jgi:Subtilase family
VNNLIKRIKRAAFGFRRFAHYRIRTLLYAGKPNWDLLATITPRGNPKSSDSDHGMGVYGIIAASTNNGEDNAGIAPNSRHIALERPMLTSVNYSDVLLWAAGFTTNNTTAGWPNESLTPAAHAQR